MRVVIAEDSVLLREGLTRLLTDRGHDVVAGVGRRGGADQDHHRAGRAGRAAGRRGRGRADAADPHRRGRAGRRAAAQGASGARGARAVAVRGGAVRHRAAGRVAAAASAICSRTGSPRCASSWTRWCGWPRGVPRWTRRSSRSCSGRSRKQDVLAGLTPAGAGGAGADGRGADQLGDRAGSWWSATAPSRSTSATSS